MQAAAKEEALANIRRMDEEAAKENKKRQQRNRQLQQQQMEREQTFKAVIEAFGQNVVEDCNAAIKRVWQESKPVFPTGIRKGEARAQPYLYLGDGQLLLFTGNHAGDGRKIKTPLSKKASYYGTPEPYWRYPEWATLAVSALSQVIEGYARQLQK
jgi:hypothetical protein